MPNKFCRFHCLTYKIRTTCLLVSKIYLSLLQVPIFFTKRIEEIIFQIVSERKVDNNLFDDQIENTKGKRIQTKLRKKLFNNQINIYDLNFKEKKGFTKWEIVKQFKNKIGITDFNKCNKVL